MNNLQYRINEDVKKRTIIYLKQLIENKAVVGERSNSNISLVKRYLNAYNIGYNEVSKKGHKSIITQKTDIILNSHVDVVPGNNEQFNPYIVSNKLYGRGSSDALGCAASLIVCAQELKRLGKQATLMIVSDEETGGLYGTKHLLENKFEKKELDKIKYVIIGEPTECFGFSVREKGILRIEVEVNGKRGHPENENTSNAIHIASDIIREIKKTDISGSKDEFYSKTLHINPTRIEGGIAPNIIPDKVVIEYDIRFAYGINTKQIIEVFEELKKKYYCKFKVLKSRNASYADTNNKYFSLLNKIAKNPKRVYNNGASDYSYFFDKGIKGVVYGIKGRRWHKDDEYVEIDSMYEYIENVVNFVLEVDRNGH